MPDTATAAKAKTNENASHKAVKKDELEILFPDVPVRTQTGQYIVSPFGFKHFKRVLELLKKYAGLVEAQPSANIFNLIVANAEDGINDIQEFIQFCCPISLEQIDALRMDEVIDLFMTAVEVNRDFLLLRIQQSGLRSSLVTGSSISGAISSAN